MPQTSTQPFAAQVRADDEQAHESKLPAVRHDRAAGDELALASHGNECLRIELPGDADVGTTRIPTLGAGPLLERRDLFAGHLIDADV